MTVINGKESILLVQPIDNTLGEDALVVAYLTENSHSIENELVDEMTKMGRILGYGENSESFEMACYGKRGDAAQLAVLNAIKKKKKLKVWEVDTVQNTSGTYDATFAYCFVESVEKSSSDSFQEVSATLQVEGQSVEGTLDSLPEGIELADGYDFEQPGETGVQA